MRLGFAAIFLVACGGTADDTIKITSANPAFAPLAGGTKVLITGQGFLRDGASPNHVLLGDGEAPVASAIDDTTLEITAPPAAMAGDVPITVFNRNGQGTAMGMFHYSTTPTVASVSPTDVVFDSLNTTVTLTGTGFKDENAGATRVTVDGVPAVDVVVTSDSSLTFTAPLGTPLSRATVVVNNGRGEGSKPAAIRFIPFAHPGLILFTKQGSTAFAFLYDPTNNKTVTIPRIPTNLNQFHEVFTDSTGAFWAFDISQNFGKLDLRTQTISDPTSAGGNFSLTSAAFVGGSLLMTDRGGRFGTYDLPTATFTVVSTTTPCCGMALATNGTNTYYANTSGISTINVTTGARGPVVPLTPAPARSIEEMRFLGGVLYGTSRQSPDLFTIDPATGATVVIHSFVNPVGPIEVFQ